MNDELAAPPIVDRNTFQAEIDALRVREKAHTHEGDAIAAARRRLPMVEVSASTPLIGERGPVTLLDAFEGRRLLVAYYFMWHTGKPAPEQCEGCTWVTSQVRELSYIHARDATYAVFCQGPYEESRRYRDFMGWEMPWYSALDFSSIRWCCNNGQHGFDRFLPGYQRRRAQTFSSERARQRTGHLRYRECGRRRHVRRSQTWIARKVPYRIAPEAAV
jgi:predicted dithiol-disulfide oxidoreductase (DUF899 family)